MIDLHIHTTCSDGVKTVEEILKMAEEKKLDYIAFTDHDRVTAYEELKKLNKKALFSGKIIYGCEVKFMHKKNQFEVLCYGYDYEKFKDSYWVSTELAERRKQEILDHCLKNAKKLGFVYGSLEYDPGYKPERMFFAELEKHEENKELFKKYQIKHSGEMYRKLLAKPTSPMFYDGTSNCLDFDGAVDLIHEYGGIAILAHPFGVYDVENPKEVLEEFLSKNKLDGIECCHTDIKPEESEYLLDLCKKHNLISTGGSDYHGYETHVFATWNKGTKDIPTSLIEKLIPRLNKNGVID